MSGVIIEELDNSSDEEFRSAGGQSKENEDDEDFYACDEGPALARSFCCAGFYEASCSQVILKQSTG